LEEKEIVQEETVETSEEIKEEKKNDEADEIKERLMRTLAEFDNYKKRTQKEKDALYEYTVCEVVSKILPVYDTLKLSLNHESEDEALKKGVELTLKQFDDVLTKLNVTEIEAVGCAFDTNFHNAVMHIDDEAYGEKEIVEVLQVGYKMNDKVIRYSMVKVAN
jgi:molecular chaperone GrpE